MQSAKQQFCGPVRADPDLLIHNERFARTEFVPTRCARIACGERPVNTANEKCGVRFIGELTCCAGDGAEKQ